MHRCRGSESVQYSFQVFHVCFLQTSLPLCKDSDRLPGCGGCGASMCPAMSWQDCGQRFYCPFCGELTEGRRQKSLWTQTEDQDPSQCFYLSCICVFQCRGNTTSPPEGWRGIVSTETSVLSSAWAPTRSWTLRRFVVTSRFNLV